MAVPYAAKPTATVYLDGQRWRAIRTLGRHQKFPENISTGAIEGIDPPVMPRIGMSVRWTWGYNGVESAGFYGEISDYNDFSYPDRWSLSLKDVLWRADKSNQVLQTDPLNEIAASDAVRYLLTHYGGIPASRIQIPSLPASGAAWAGSEWVLGILTPVQWGDVDTGSGGTSALKAAVQICEGLGYWLYADSAGIVRAKLMERKPSQTARETFERDLNLLREGAPQRQQSYERVFNLVTVHGANTGVDGAQLYDQRRTNHPLLPPGTDRDYPYTNELLEYENAADAGAASVSSVAARILNVVSRIPDVISLRVKADPSRNVGDTVGIIDTGILIAAQKSFFIYQVDREMDLLAGKFDDALQLDGGTGNTGFTTVPPPDASFSWDLMRETLDGVDVTEVALDGSASTSPSGEIVSWAWSTSTTTYGSTPNTATGEQAVFVFETADSPAHIVLIVTDTTSKTGTFEADVDLTGADTRAPLRDVVGVAVGAAYYVTPDGGATWNVETANGDAIAVSTIGAGADDRALGTGGAYGMLATRGSGGAGGVRITLDTLATASTNGVSNSGAITSNIWQNEANPARVWFAIGTAVYRSVDGGLTKTAMHAAPGTVTWIMEDPSVDNSVFIACGADLLNATDPTVGWAVLYSGPIGATARQFVRSRDGQVTWVCYTGAPSGESLQRVENGAAGDFAATDVRTLALDRNASSVKATVYAITGDDPAALWSFDGLTGLDAFQSAQTFPAGATVQHMLGSRQFDVFYTANFDGVTTGTGSLHKYFPTADQLLLWKALASGQQGHMLGLGARATAPAEFLLTSVTIGPCVVYHYDRNGIWQTRPLPVATTGNGVTVVADPFNADRWLAAFNNGDFNRTYTNGSTIVGASGWAHSPLWFTEDAGVTWTEVIINEPPNWVDASLLYTVSFNELTGNSWMAIFGGGGSAYTAMVLGSGTTVTTVIEDLTASAIEVRSGADGEWLTDVSLSSSLDGLRYLDTSNVLHRPSGAQPADFGASSFDRLPGTSRTVFISSGDIYATTDYRAAQPTSLLTGLSADTVSVSATALYYADGGNVFRIVDPLGAATSTQITSGNAKTAPRVDRQTRTIMGVLVGGAIVVDDGVATRTIALPAATISDNTSGGLYGIEVMVRP